MNRQGIAALAVAFAVYSATAHAQEPPSIDIARSGSHTPSKGSADSFTGTVTIDPFFPARAPSRVLGGSVTFEPGARTAWHTHPLGQILIVTDGAGWIQQWGGPVEDIRKGDVIWIPPGVKHWHGASPATAITHIAIQEQLNGKFVEWMEKVTGENTERVCREAQGGTTETAARDDRCVRDGGHPMGSG